MNSVSERKSQLRKELLKTRNSLSESDWSKKSAQIITQLKSIKQFEEAEIIHCYISMNQRKEVDTQLLIQEMLSQKKKVLVPVTDFEKMQLNTVEINSFDDLSTNKWGVLEPKSLVQTALKADLVIVPLLAADLKFNRLGYGKGFYDRFLKSEKSTKAGLLFEDFLLPEIPVEAFDEKLDILITEKSVYNRNNQNQPS